MATLKLRRPENAPGDFFVDSTCIDCDTCRWMAPETFGQAGEMSAVHAQPASDAAVQRALAALISCPTASIGTERKHDLAPVRAGLPAEIEAGVYHCGYHAESSFGAASYLVVRTSGNVLIDSPRFAGPLVKRLEELGGVKTLFLTHQDDVADHARFHAHFGCERILHADDAHGELRALEHLVHGAEPVRLDAELELIPTPGHTRGSACLLYAERFLFTGDHLARSSSAERLTAFRSACWYDWGAQIESMRRLARHPFEWVLPGHGRRVWFPRARMQAELERLIAWMETRR